MSEAFRQRNKRDGPAKQAERRAAEWLTLVHPAPFVVVRFGKDQATEDKPWKAHASYEEWEKTLSRSDVLVALPSFESQPYETLPNDKLDLTRVHAHVEIKSRGTAADSPGWKIGRLDFERRRDWERRQLAEHRRIFGEPEPLADYDDVIPVAVSPPVYYALVSQDPNDDWIGLIPLHIAEQARRVGFHGVGDSGENKIDTILAPEAVAGRYWYDLSDTRPLWEQQPKTRPRFVLDWAENLPGGPARLVYADDLPKDVRTLTDKMWATPAVLAPRTAQQSRTEPPSGSQLVFLHELADALKIPMPLPTNMQDASRQIVRLVRMKERSL